MTGNVFNSLGSFAEHLLHVASHFSEHLVHELGHEAGLGGGGMRMGGGAGGGEASPQAILKEGAEIVRREVAKGLAGANVFGLAPLAASTIAKKGSQEYLKETGALQASLRVSVGEHEAHVGSNDEKITYLELGTSKMPPRPVFRSAAMVAEPLVHAMVRAKVAAAMR